MKRTKVCTRCGRRRALGEFQAQPEKYDRRGHSAGRGPWCLACRTEANREWREANRDEFLAAKRAYEARPEVRARRRARDRRRKRVAA